MCWSKARASQPKKRVGMKEERESGEPDMRKCYSHGIESRYNAFVGEEMDGSKQRRRRPRPKKKKK